jgi:hypothetical protein
MVFKAVAVGILQTSNMYHVVLNKIVPILQQQSFYLLGFHMLHETLLLADVSEQALIDPPEAMSLSPTEVNKQL